MAVPQYLQRGRGSGGGGLCRFACAAAAEKQRVQPSVQAAGQDAPFADCALVLPHQRSMKTWRTPLLRACSTRRFRGPGLITSCIDRRWNRASLRCSHNTPAAGSPPGHPEAGGHTPEAPKPPAAGGPAHGDDLQAERVQLRERGVRLVRRLRPRLLPPHVDHLGAWVATPSQISPPPRRRLCVKTRRDRAGGLAPPAATKPSPRIPGTRAPPAPTAPRRA